MEGVGEQGNAAGSGDVRLLCHLLAIWGSLPMFFFFLVLFCLCHCLFLIYLVKNSHCSLNGTCQNPLRRGHLCPHRYWHRSLNPRKLIEVKFSHLSRNMTMQRTMKLYRLPEASGAPGAGQGQGEPGSLVLSRRGARLRVGGGVRKRTQPIVSRFLTFLFCCFLRL